MRSFLRSLTPVAAACLAASSALAADGSRLDLDALMEQHWRSTGIRPTALADEATLFRRLMLDLVGRVPTRAEVIAFAADKAPDKYTATVRRLIDGPEFEWYFATVLDEMIQGRFSGDEAFVSFLRGTLRDRQGWDAVFRSLLIGPWDAAPQKSAVVFLDRRARDLDQMTADITRTFFGVDISCARCHDHPLVADWKKDHYYGMAAFLARTTRGKGGVSEKADGEARFAGRDGQDKVAPMMFLSGRIVTPAAGEKPPPSRRAALVQVALEEKSFFARAFVNRVWEYLLGRGLVSPVDQMHSGNPASIPPVLDALANDFIAHGYDIRRLVTTVVLSRTYRLASRGDGATAPDPGHFAVARIRPLSARQFARSFVLAVGDGRFDGSAAQLAALDRQANALLPALDPRTVEFQSSTREALFVSNAEPVRAVIAAEGGLARRLTTISADAELVEFAVKTVDSRPATPAEVTALTAWLKRQPDRAAACEDLVWALAASAEFRFNH